MLKALVISNGIGSEKAYHDIDVIQFHVAHVGPGFDPDLTDYDLLVVPNGTDHVPRGDIITWETRQYGGTLFVSTLDPIVEHGIQQIRHLDHFIDNLTVWLCGIRPEGTFSVLPEAYGVQTEAFLAR